MDDGHVCRGGVPEPEEVAGILTIAYCLGMVDLKLQVAATEPVEVDADTLAAIDRGTADADANRTVSLEEARQLLPKWISKFESRTPR